MQIGMIGLGRMGVEFHPEESHVNLFHSALRIGEDCRVIHMGFLNIIRRYVAAATVVRMRSIS